MFENADCNDELWDSVTGKLRVMNSREMAGCGPNHPPTRLADHATTGATGVSLASINTWPPHQLTTATARADKSTRALYSLDTR